MASRVGMLLGALLVAGCTTAPGGAGPGPDTSVPDPAAVAEAAAFGEFVLPPDTVVLNLYQQGSADEIRRFKIAVGPDSVDDLLRDSQFTGTLEPVAAHEHSPEHDPATMYGPVSAGQDQLPGGLPQRPSTIRRSIVVDTSDPARTVIDLQALIG